MRVSLDHAILGFLSERPRSGYDLKTRCFEGVVRAFWNADQAQIYRTLDRLQQSRMVRSTRRKQAGRPDRRIYEITQLGQESLDAWLAESAPLPALRDPFLVQLYFGASLTDEAVLEVLSARREAHQRSLENLRERAAALSHEHHLPARTMVLRQTALEGAMARERASIDWLDDSMDAVRAGALPGSSDEGIGQRHLFGSAPA